MGFVNKRIFRPIMVTPTNTAYPPQEIPEVDHLEIEIRGFQKALFPLVENALSPYSAALHESNLLQTRLKTFRTNREIKVIPCRNGLDFLSNDRIVSQGYTDPPLRAISSGTKLDNALEKKRDRVNILVQIINMRWRILLVRTFAPEKNQQEMGELETDIGKFLQQLQEAEEEKKSS